MRARRQRRDKERGTATVELVILTPLLIIVLLLVVALGRLAGARIDVDGVAAQAARAASIARSAAAATSSAQETATSALESQHITCAHLAVSVDTANFTPGGSVAVTVSCAVDLADLTGLDLPGTETVANRAVSPIDEYRSVSG
jgi:Flp pilus assembly protein TadG